MTAALIVGFFIPIFSLPISLYGIRINFKNWRIYIFFLALCLATAAYSYTPVKNEPDIVRYFEWTKQLANMSLGDALVSSVNGQSEVYVMNLLLWIGGKLGDVHLIPALSVFFVYYICFYILCYTAEKENISPRHVLAYLLFVLLTLNFYAITNNVRNVLGFSLVGLAAFRELYQSKKNWFTLFLYIFPIFLHQSVIVLVLVRLLLFIPGNYKLIAIVAASQVVWITDILYKITASWAGTSNIIFSVLRNMIDKAYWFYRNQDSAWAIAVANSGSQKLSKIVYIAIAVILCGAIYFGTKKKNDNRNFIDYVFYIGIITIACAPMPMPEYWRFVSAFLVLGGGIFISMYVTKGNRAYYLSKSVYIFTPICTMLWVREFIKMDFGEFATGIFFMNPIMILIKDLFGLLFNA